METTLEDTEFGRELIESLGEVRDHLDGKTAPPAALSAAARTVEGWPRHSRRSSTASAFRLARRNMGARRSN
jgi:hypothetical protein